MQQLIVFRKGIDSLEDQEYNECIKLFIQQCTMSFDRDCISTILFKHFCHEINDNKMININKINNIIANIVTSRKNKSITNNNNDDDEDIDIATNDINDDDENNEEKEHKPTTLDQLPSVLLSEISSYLSFGGRLYFERCNRSMFIGSRTSKIPIHSLNNTQFTKLVNFCSENNMENSGNFKIFKSVTIESDDVIELHKDEKEWKLKYKWNNLNVMKYIDTLKICYDEQFEVDLILNDLSNQDLSNIKTIKLICSDDIESNALDILSSITSLKLEFFESSGTSLDNDCFVDCKWISTLKGIAINNYDHDDGFMEDIYSKIGDHLESFHKNYEEITNAINGKLKNLKEMCLSWSPIKSEIEILLKQNLNKLKRIHFRNVYDDYNKDLMQPLIDKLIKTVEYICFDIDYQYAEILNILTKSLENIKKNKLKIRINRMKTNDMDHICEFVKGLKELINTLNSNCLHWMVIVYDMYVPEKNKISDELDNLLKSESEKKQFCVSVDGKPIHWNKVKILQCDDLLDDLLESMKHKYCINMKKRSLTYNFIINNKECHIGGYQENWIMRCQECEQQIVNI